MHYAISKCLCSYLNTRKKHFEVTLIYRKVGSTVRLKPSSIAKRTRRAALRVPHEFVPFARDYHTKYRRDRVPRERAAVIMRYAINRGIDNSNLGVDDPFPRCTGNRHKNETPCSEFLSSSERNYAER